MIKGINVFCGTLGAGKTYGTMLAVLSAWKNGYEVYSNMTMFPPEKYSGLYHHISYHDILEVMNKDFIQHGTGKEVILVLDEGWIFFDAYEKTKKDVRILLMSARKNGIHIYITSQRWGLVNINVRAVVERVFIGNSSRFLGVFWSQVRYLEYDIDRNSDNGKLADEPIEEPLLRNGFLYRRRETKIYKLYDTYEKITEMYPMNS